MINSFEDEIGLNKDQIKRSTFVDDSLEITKTQQNLEIEFLEESNSPAVCEITFQPASEERKKKFDKRLKRTELEKNRCFDVLDHLVNVDKRFCLFLCFVFRKEKSIDEKKIVEKNSR